MDSALLKNWAARVAAWYHRDPLAERLSPGSVHSIGSLSLPFVVPAVTAATVAPAEAAPPALPADTPPAAGEEAASPPRGVVTRLRTLVGQLPRPSMAWLRWRRGELARGADAARSGWQPAFTEDCIPGLPTAQIAHFARRYGVAERPGEPDWPQRELVVDPGCLPAAAASPSADAAAPDVQRLYLLTAAIETPAGRARVLMAPDAAGALLGRRQLSRRRTAVAGGVVLAGVLLAGGLGVALRSTAPHPAVVASAGAPAASAGAGAGAGAASPRVSASAAVASIPASGPLPEAGDAPHGMPHGGGVVAASAAAEGLPPSEAPPAARGAASGAAPPVTSQAQAASAVEAPASEVGRITLPFPPRASGRPALVPVPSPPPLQAPADGPAPRPPATAARPAPPAAPVAVPTHGKVFALMSRGPRSRAEADLLLARFIDAASTLRTPSTAGQIEVMNLGGTWRAVWWPFPSRDDATSARWALALKGVTVDVVEF